VTKAKAHCNEAIIRYCAFDPNVRELRFHAFNATRSTIIKKLKNENRRLIINFNCIQVLSVPFQAEQYRVEQTTVLFFDALPHKESFRAP
jgi:hypothetical protein